MHAWRGENDNIWVHTGLGDCLDTDIAIHGTYWPMDIYPGVCEMKLHLWLVYLPGILATAM